MGAPKTPNNTHSGRAQPVIDVDVSRLPPDVELPLTVEDVHLLDDETVLSFHAVSQIPTTIDMTPVTEDAARELGAVACSHCYRDVDGVSYDFPHMNGGLR
jgi:hypothetical protein